MGDEIERKDLNTLMSIAETNNLADLSSIGYIGWRHSREIMRGLCVYISAELQHYTNIEQSDYSLHGAINLPAIDGKTPISVGFLCTYRSPSLTKNEEHEEYLDDIARVLDKLRSKHENVYLMGDLNMYDIRYEIIREVGENCGKYREIAANSCSQTIFYHMFHKMLPTANYRHLFMGAPTHKPYQIDMPTRAQLDYMIILWYNLV